MQGKHHMQRLSVTLDADTALRLEELPDRLREVRRAGNLDDLALVCLHESRFLTDLAHSLDSLGGEPSAAAVLRAALGWYLTIADDLERTALLEIGYSTLAEDEEREPILSAITTRAAAQWAGEP